jgi:hypothetical protein
MSESQVTADAGASRRHGVPIFINDAKYDAPKALMTGVELLELAGLPSANQLFMVVPGPAEDRPVAPDEQVVLRGGMRFYDVPVGTFG